MQAKAAGVLMSLASNADNQVTIAAVGTIPPLVRLLGSADVQNNAAAALLYLAKNADNKITIATAGAIPSLVQLLAPGCDAVT
ncbi:hypothetical protein FOA52_013158 [Chlamydomonas sp. UWO 241]|nr:hypothetical protein FOA52_013158 [Chlamydomonas sp. UWO 241]